MNIKDCLKKRKVFIPIIVIIVVALSIIAAVAVDLVYYNPNKGYKSDYGDTSGQFFIDASVFTELHSPGHYTNFAEAKSKGLGRYDITISQANSFERENKIYIDEIVRGKIYNMHKVSSEFWNFAYANAFGGLNGYVPEQSPEERKSQVDELKKLPSYSRVSAYFGFKNNVTLKDLEKLNKDSNLYFSYVAVRIGEEGRYQDILGFEPTGTGLIIDKKTLPEDIYPYFEIANYRDEFEESPAKVWEGHFKTLLKYMGNRPEFLSTMASINNISTSFYKDALSYVNKNGVNIYGVLVHGSASDVLAFEHQDNILNINVDDVKLSSLSK